MIEHRLKNGTVIRVDDEDADLLRWSWKTLKNLKYPHRTLHLKRDEKGRRKYGTLYIHRAIMERMLGRPLEKREWVDHEDQDLTNATRGNLRLCNPSQNHWNAKTRCDNKSGVRGVFWDKKKNKWGCYAYYKGKTKYYGRFKRFEDAVVAVRKAQLEVGGEFCHRTIKEAASAQ